MAHTYSVKRDGYRKGVQFALSTAGWLLPVPCKNWNFALAVRVRVRVLSLRDLWGSTNCLVRGALSPRSLIHLPFQCGSDNIHVSYEQNIVNRYISKATVIMK